MSSLFGYSRRGSFSNNNKKPFKRNFSLASCNFLTFNSSTRHGVHRVQHVRWGCRRRWRQRQRRRRRWRILLIFISDQRESFSHFTGPRTLETTKKLCFVSFDCRRHSGGSSGGDELVHLRFSGRTDGRLIVLAAWEIVVSRACVYYFVVLLLMCAMCVHLSWYLIVLSSSPSLWPVPKPKTKFFHSCISRNQRERICILMGFDR